jgi:hypothetical protein
MTFTDKDYEDALRLRKVTELAKPVVSIADGTHFPSGSSAGSYTFTTPSSKMFLLATPPKPVGGYRMGEEANGGYIIFSIPKKPCWLHRMGVRLVLGWKWVDA